MPAEIIDGRKIAAELESSLRQRIESLGEKGVVPGLAVIIAGEDPASKIYVKKKEKACAGLGILSRKIELPAKTPEEEIIKEVKELNADEKIHGILVQLPLPNGINKRKVIETVSPDKDVDGFTSPNLGKLVRGNEFLAPCTPCGVVKLIESTGTELQGKRACIVGHGAVGMPLSIMLLNRNATLSICDKFTQFLGQETPQAEVLVVAAGVPNLIKAEMVKPGAVVIDVGINRVGGKLCGDVDFEAVKERASFITPVPGGVGPMTVACLMENTVNAAEKAAGVKK